MSVRNWSRVGAATVVGGLLVMGVATPAWAAPGDASGTAFDIAFDTDAPFAVLAAGATLASATAPPNEAVTGLGLAANLGPATGLAGAAGTLSASATSDAVSSDGESAIDGFDLELLGQAISADQLSGAASCPAAGGADADTVVTNLTVFGDAIATATVNGPAVTADAAVTVPGLTDATLVATIQTRIETITATAAEATALRIDFELTGTVNGTATVVPVGSLVLGDATCEAAVVPTATDLTPPSGPDEGGTEVTVTGSGFIPGATTVTIGGNTVDADDVTVTSPTTLTFDTPAHAAGPVQVVVNTIGGSSVPLDYAYLADSTATGLTPPTGTTDGGTTVTVTGTDFVPGATSVTIGGNTVPATAVTVTSPTTLTFATPAHAAGPVQVAVTTPGGTSGPLDYTYVAPVPVITGLTPDAGPTAGGTTVTVTGTGFVPGATTVTIDGTVISADQVTVTSPTTLTFVTPAGTAGAVAVTVTTPAGTSAPLSFTYLDAPVATSLTPGTGQVAGGDVITVTGSGFVPGAPTVSIGGILLPAADVEVTNSTTLRFRAPAHAAGLVTVTVSTSGGTSATLSFRYTDGPATTAANLAYTGFDTAVPLVAGLAALIGGAGVLVLSRRRRSTTS